MVVPNEIQEIYPGHFQVVLDFPRVEDVDKMLDKEQLYVWLFQHSAIGPSWEEHPQESFFEGNTASDKDLPKVLVRNLSGELLMSTSSYLASSTKYNHSVNIVQSSIKPPYYLNLNKFKGRKRYDFLTKTIDYKVEIIIPKATDYAPVTSPDRAFLEALVAKFR